MSYFAHLGERELLIRPWDPVVLLLALLKCTIPGVKHTIERGEKVGVLIGHIPLAVHLLMPDGAASPG